MMDVTFAVLCHLCSSHFPYVIFYLHSRFFLVRGLLNKLRRVS